jgi:hypothetical protein
LGVAEAHREIALSKADFGLYFKTTVNKKSKTSRKSTRADGMTNISISLSESLVGKIDQMAGAENRNRSNFIVNVIQELVAKARK